MKNVVVDIEFNNEPASEYDYKYFKVKMKKGKVHIFNHHKNNPIPVKEEMLELTWFEVIELCRKKFYEAIERGVK